MSSPRIETTTDCQEVLSALEESCQHVESKYAVDGSSVWSPPPPAAKTGPITYATMQQALIDACLTCGLDECKEGGNCKYHRTLKRLRAQRRKQR